MKNTSKVVLSTLLASAVLGGSNFASANEDKVTTPVVDDKPVTVVDKADKVEKETPKVNGVEDSKADKVEKETPKPNGVEDSKADKVEKETPKPNGVEDSKANEVEKEVPKVNGVEDSKADKVEKETPKPNGVEDSKANELNKKETPKTNTDFNKVVDNATTKQELKSVINSTDKLTDEQKQDLTDKVENVQNQEQLKEVKELAKTGTTTSVFATILGFLAMASAVVLRKFKKENI